MAVFRKNASFILLTLLFSVAAFAQDTSVKPVPIQEYRRYTPQPVLPEFPGGKDSMAIFIKNNLRYPKKARKHHISGIIQVNFTVSTDGTLKNATVFKSLGYGCDEEALRIVHLMPKWIPGRKGRDPMELDYHINIPFGKQKQTTKNSKK